MLYVRFGLWVYSGPDQITQALYDRKPNTWMLRFPFQKTKT
jgi:hypothetical protein